MYIEYLLLIFDYFKTLSRKNFLFEIFIPIALGIIVICILYFAPHIISTNEFINNSINIIGVLLGFTLAIITFFVASDNNNIEKTKTYLTQYKIGAKKISLYKLLIINYSYIVIIETIICLCFLIGGLVYPSLPFLLQIIIKGIYISLVIHVFLLTIRSITDLYFILIKE